VCVCVCVCVCLQVCVCASIRVHACFLNRRSVCVCMCVLFGHFLFYPSRSRPTKKACLLDEHTNTHKDTQTHTLHTYTSHNNVCCNHQYHHYHHHYHPYHYHYYHYYSLLASNASNLHLLALLLLAARHGLCVCVCVKCVLSVC